METNNPTIQAHTGDTLGQHFWGNVFSDKCPSRDILNHVTSRWGTLLLVALLDGTFRFSELRRKINGVSEKMLAQTLQTLEQDGFVERIDYQRVPPHVEYRLTPLGQTVGQKIASLVQWIEQNMPAIQSAKSKISTSKAISHKQK